MKTLVMVVTHVLHETYIENIKNSFENADFALITSEEYKGSVDFKYKVVNPNHPLSKVCSFLISLEEKYDWYVKIRPEVELNRCVTFDNLSKDAINARCRAYTGSKRIPFGASLGGVWQGAYADSIKYHPEHEHIILDDQMYIFHRNVFEQGMCSPPVEQGQCNEWCHAVHWVKNGIKVNPVGFELNFHHLTVGMSHSTHINI